MTHGSTATDFMRQAESRHQWLTEVRLSIFVGRLFFIVKLRARIETRQMFHECKCKGTEAKIDL